MFKLGIFKLLAQLISKMENNKFDEVFARVMELCNQSNWIDDLFIHLFDFLKRKSNFYTIVRHEHSEHGFQLFEAKDKVFNAFELFEHVEYVENSEVGENPEEPTTITSDNKRNRINSSFFHEQTTKKQKSNDLDFFNTFDPDSVLSLSELLQNISKNCRKLNKKPNGCLLPLIEKDINNLGHQILQLNYDTKIKKDEELNQHLRNLFDSCICKNTKKTKSNSKFQMNYIILGSNVCRACFAYAHGISRYQMDELAKSYHDPNLGNLNAQRHDYESIQEYNYGETERTFRSNNCSTDPSLVRAAITPHSSTQIFCTVWLKKYFNIFGDEAPNRQETYLSLCEKQDVYEIYVEEFQKYPDLAVVTYPRFLEIWNVLFPRVVIRKYCEVLGKCSTCYEIDKRRKETNCKAVQEAIKIVQQIHRGGIVMPERIMYHERVLNSVRKNTEFPGEKTRLILSDERN